MYHSIKTNVIRHTYLYRWFDYAWQEISESFHSAYALRQTGLYMWYDHTWKEPNLSHHSDQSC